MTAYHFTLLTLGLGFLAYFILIIYGPPLFHFLLNLTEKRQHSKDKSN